MKRAYTDYLRDILDAAEKAEQFLSGVSEEQFKTNDEKIVAVVRALKIVGEAAGAIPGDGRNGNSILGKAGGEVGARCGRRGRSAVAAP